MRMLGWAIGASIAVAAVSAQQRTIWDGVYTEEQANRGEKLYAQHCAACHGDTLGGVESAPALAGDVFNGNWEGMTLDTLHERMRSTMPQDKPGSLTRTQNADILAHMLRAGNFPPGPQELGSDAGALAAIRFATHKPQR